MNMDEPTVADKICYPVNNRETNLDESAQGTTYGTAANSTETNLDESTQGTTDGTAANIIEVNVNEVESYNLITVNREDCSFKIDYAKTKDFGINRCVWSPAFTCCGYDWRIGYYPQGIDRAECNGFISLFLELESNAQNINSTIGFSVLGEDSKPLSSRNLWSHFRHKGSSRGCGTFIKRSLLESDYLREGCFVVKCDIKVQNEGWEKTPTASGVLAPFRSLHDELHGMLMRNEMTDVVIDVQGQLVTAHRLVLASRSTWFKEELANSIALSVTFTGNIVLHDDISLVVFKIILYFMYTDALPPIHELFESDSSERNVELYGLTEDVMVAAHTFKLDHLKRICEEKLARHISMETVVTSLELAYQCSCPLLQEACFKFATKPENIMEFMQSDGYVDLMRRYHSLLAEFREFNANFSPFKKQRME